MIYLKFTGKFFSDFITMKNQTIKLILIILAITFLWQQVGWGYVDSSYSLRVVAFDERTDADENLIFQKIDGEREAEVVFDKEFLSVLPADVLERIKRIITEYPDNWLDGDHDGETGTAEEKKAVCIKLAKPIMFHGEEIVEIGISGVLFTRANLGKVWLGRSLGASKRKARDVSQAELDENAVDVEFDEEGRPIHNRAYYPQLGGLGDHEARMKFVHSRTSLPRAGLRTTIAGGYGRYTKIRGSSNNETLGFFISARRKGEMDRYGSVVHQILARFYQETGRAIEQEQQAMLAEVQRKMMTGKIRTGQFIQLDPKEVARKVGQQYDIAGIYRAYGKALRELNDAGFYPKDPHHGNMALDITGKEEPIWYDVGMYRLRQNLTKAQAFGYRYWTLTYGMQVVLRDMGTEGLTLAYISGLVDHPGREFLKGYFHDRLDDPLFNLDDFKISREDGSTSLDEVVLVRENTTPVYLQLKAPFVPLLRVMEGFDAEPGELQISGIEALVDEIRELLPYTVRRNISEEVVMNWLRLAAKGNASGLFMSIQKFVQQHERSILTDPTENICAAIFIFWQQQPRLASPPEASPRGILCEI